MRHERFAQCVASGDSAAGAYRRVYTEASPATVETEGPATARMPQVSLRISWLKAAGADEVTKRFAWEKLDALQFALRVVETPIGAVDENDSLCQEFTTKADEKKYKMPSKLEALEKIVKMMGWNEPDKLDLNKEEVPPVEQLARTPAGLAALARLLAQVPGGREAFAVAVNS